MWRLPTPRCGRQPGTEISPARVGLDVLVADRGGCNQINVPAKQALEGLAQTEVCVRVTAARQWLKLDEQVHIAAIGVEVVTRGGPEDGQASHAILPTQVDKRGALVVDERAHVGNS